MSLRALTTCTVTCQCDIGQESRQVAAGPYAKSFAALRKQTPETAQELTSAVTYIQKVAGET